MTSSARVAEVGRSAYRYLPTVPAERPHLAQLTATPPLIVDRGSGVALYRQIEEQLREAIIDGRLRPGARLPPIRRLSEELGVGRITVITAYEQLAAEGYVIGRVGSGTRVADRLPEEALRASSNRSRLRLTRQQQASWAAPPPLTERAQSLVGPIRASSSVMFDFAVRPPGSSMLAPQTWERLYRRAWNHRVIADRDIRAPRTAADSLLRRAISEYVGITRGVRCEPEDIVVAPTTQAILCAAADLWLAPDRAVVVEDPSCPGGLQGLERQEPVVLPVRVDGQGVVTDELPAKATMAVFTPSCQFPTGVTLSLERRQKLIAWGRDTGALLVELDLDSHYRYAGRALPALRALDGDNRVLYVGDFGHVLFNGIGIAFAVVPAAAREAMREVLGLVGHTVPAVDQHALALLITEGHLDRHLRRLRLTQLKVRDVMLHAIRAELAEWADASAPDVGTRITLELRSTARPAFEIARAAYRLGVRVGQIWHVSGDADPSRLSLVFGSQDPTVIWNGIRRLRRAFEA